jgi:regulator of nucleoside diphosphate kinase
VPFWLGLKRFEVTESPICAGFALAHDLQKSRVMYVKGQTNIEAVVLGAEDTEKLRTLVEGERAPYSLDRFNLLRLEDELERATVVPQAELPADVIRMHSRIQLKDLETGVELNYVLVYPHQAGSFPGAISVVAPVGTALLGHAAGAEIEWVVPRGVRRLKVLAVRPPPERLSEERVA